MKLDHSFVEELTALTSEVKPIKLINSPLAVFNNSLAIKLNLTAEWQYQADLFKAFYANGGHQFGLWNSALSDGRGQLLTEAIDKYKQRRDLHLNGAGPTPYSRLVDERAVLRSR